MAGEHGEVGEAEGFVEAGDVVRGVDLSIEGMALVRGEVGEVAGFDDGVAAAGWGQGGEVVAEGFVFGGVVGAV